MSSSVETYQERQENELLALQSIFGDEVQDLRVDGVWKTWQPLDVKITLFPQQGSSGLGENHAKIDLHVKCGEMYPDVEPAITLEKSRGLPDRLVMLLQTELEKMVMEHKGEVMIFELTRHIQEFLFKHSTKDFTNLYDEMLNRQKQKQQEILQEKKRKEDIERQAFKDEVQRRKEMLRTEPRLKKLSVNENEMHLLHPGVERVRANSRKRCSSENSDGSLCEHRGTKLLYFSNKGERQIHRGRCIGHSDRGSILYSGLDMTTGEIVAITEWHIKLQNANSPKDPKQHPGPELPDLQHCVKQIASIEQELNFLMKLRHMNLVNYLNMKYAQENDMFVVYILQEFVVGINCSSLFLSENFSIEIDMLRHFAEGILNALDFLHKNNVIHRDLRDSCVFIDQTGVVKLSDYSLDKRLYELTTRSQNQNRNHSKKTDIFKFGLLMLSLLRGCPVDETSPKVPVSLPGDLRDFLYKCISTDERARWTAAQLLKHGFVRCRPERCSPARSLDDTPALGPGGDSTPCRKSSQDNTEDDEDGDLKTFIPVQSGGQSRIHNEFEVLKWLGKGAYGDVLKVRNKLDGGSYAIKRIQLDPKNKQLNRKITREVKLLSRLNHENVVRYYNSWIESATLDVSGSEDSSDQKTSPEVEVKSEKDKKDDLIGFPGDDIELLAPPMCDVEWSVSYESKSKPGTQSATASSDDETSDDDDDDDDDDWDFVPNTDPVSDSSDSIEFEKDSGTVDSDFQSAVESPKSNTTPKNQKEDSVLEKEKPCTKEIQFMYIQMEFCEKSTLRNAIDNGLHKDIDRVWRLFREIVEGLSHIHQQGMIHRDLKPVNIFLDSNDHVKIGDFGLATTNILLRHNTGLESIAKSVQDVRDSYVQEIPSITADGSLTGQVGTALYSAPELNATANKAIYNYNQKVDIYSLGIILFEMVYVPLKTTMERVNVLANLRHRDINFPEDFCESQYAKFRYVVRWLLNHDPSQRPTSQELLQSEYIPPPVIEEYELQEVVRHTLANTQSKAYRYLIASCFDQDITPAEDITYDMSVPRGKSTHDKSLVLQGQVKAVITKIFKLHGGQPLTTPLLMPKSKYYESTQSCVKMMTHSGEIITIPHDLRVCFARYVAWNSVTNIKRYAIERVFREKKVLGFHPRELYECAFDIITPTTGNFMAEAELLSIVYEITQEFSALKYKYFMIKLNHVSLLKGILLHCGIEEEKHNDIYSILSDARDGKFSKFQIQTHLISLCLTDQAMNALFNLIDTKSPLAKVTNLLRMVTKRKGEASALVKRGLKELEIIIQNTEALGVKCNIVIAPGLVYNVHQYSGMMCQFVCELKKKRRKGGMDVLAAGGRYDNMLADFRSKLTKTGMGKKDVHHFGAGISISLDYLVQALQEEETQELIDSSLDVVVTSIGTKSMLHEKCQVLRELWSAGIRCSLIDSNSLLDIQEQCRELNVSVIIVLKDTEQNTLRIQTWERDRFQDVKINVKEVVDYMHKVLKIFNESTNETVTSANQLVRSESRSSSFCSDISYSSSNALPTINFRFMLPEKLVASAKRRYENLMLTQLNAKLQRISSRTKVEVVATNLERIVIMTLTSHLESESDNVEFEKCIAAVFERHSCNKKYLREICDVILELKTEKIQSVIVLYGLYDQCFKILL